MSESVTRTDLRHTTPVSAAEVERMRQERRARLGEAMTSLIIYFRDGVRVVPLIEGTTTVVGRAIPADVTIRDPSLSREHASFEVDGGRIWVEDLGSTNGTWVDGERIERTLVGVGAELMLGAAEATIQAVTRSEGETFGLMSHDALIRELDTEVYRALAYGRHLSLVVLKTRSREPGHLATWLSQVRPHLEPHHRLALFSSTSIEVLMPEASSEQAVTFAQGAIDGSDQVVGSIASLSGRVRSSEALLEAALEALRRASRATPVVVASLDRGGVESVVSDESREPIIASPRMKKLFALVARLSKTAIPVLINGETGSGKEIVARAVHEGGPRADRPFVAINCGAIPTQLVEATLFGHEKGAFTGATQRNEGVFESADGDTVLLDEIGELPAAAQTALLRVLETKQVTRVGSSREVEVDVRILAATHRDLEEMVHAGDFRQDLLYRLDAMTITIPPLRERLEDIEPLTSRFIAMASAANGCQVAGIARDALELLRRYRWPGNVRELRNAIERAVVIAQGPTIDVEDLPERVREIGRDFPTLAPAPEAPAIESSLGEPLKVQVQRFEAEVIQQALEKAQWDRKVAAARLEIPLRTLSYKIHVYGLKR